MTKPVLTKITHGVAALALAFSASACAQKSGPTPVQTTQVAAEEVEMASNHARPAMWKVSDADTTIYLLGTVHILPKEIEWFNPTIASALQSSDVLVTEILSGQATDAQTQQLMMSKGMLPAGTTLRSKLNAEQTARYEAALAGLGFPASGLDPFKPWAAALTISMLPLMQQGWDIESGVEEVLERNANPEMGRVALETPEFQLDIFDSMDDDAQITFLMEAVDAVPTVNEQLDSLVAAWAAGDAELLGSLMNESLTDPKLASALLYDRNANWAGWLDARMDQPGTVFVAVGAGHLAGEQSVQDLLAKRGHPSARIQ